MTKEEKLKEVISFAVERGWKNNLGNSSWSFPKNNMIQYANIIEDKVLEHILFSHSFAQAVFGEEEIKVFDGFDQQDVGDGYMEDFNRYRDEISWQHHLQQAVIAKDPVEYYWEYVKKTMQEQIESAIM